MTKIKINYLFNQYASGYITTNLFDDIKFIINSRLTLLKEQYRNILLNDIQLVINNNNNKTKLINDITNLINDRLYALKEEYRTILINDITDKILLFGKDIKPIITKSPYIIKNTKINNDKELDIIKNTKINNDKLDIIKNTKINNDKELDIIKDTKINNDKELDIYKDWIINININRDTNIN
jgi:hypothetical protein